MNKKKIFKAYMLVKIPLLIYLVITLSTLPGIDALDFDVIPGAHRGDSVEYPENSMEAFRAALEKDHYQFIEFDIQYTKDKQIIVSHDKRLLRTQGTLWAVNNLTYDELQEVSEYEIPLYKDVMDLISDKKKANVEIKSNGNLEHDKELVDFVIKDAKERGVLDNIMISAISRDVVIYTSEKYPEIKTGQIFFIKPYTFISLDFITDDLYEEAEETGADYLLLYGSNIHNMDKIAELKPEDKTLIIWYLNNEIYIVQKDPTDQMW